MSGKPRHGHCRNLAHSPTYSTWLAMAQRCNNPAHSSYYRYGGRGVTVCKRWADSFESFLADMGERPAGKTIDRIDGTKGYEPGNCRWATAKEQSANRLINNRGQADKTHCPAGHPYSGDNLHVRKRGGRECRTCMRIRTRTRRAGVQAEASE